MRISELQEYMDESFIIEVIDSTGQTLFYTEDGEPIPSEILNRELNFITPCLMHKGVSYCVK